MDTSKQYIEMCRKAVEIQDREPEQFDLYYPNGIYIYHTLRAGGAPDSYQFQRGFDMGGANCVYKDDIGCWLPRQDQLQEMVLKKDRYLTGMFYNLYEFSREHLYSDDGNTLIFHSFEQLWLAYVMKEKYNKVWNDKEWVNAIP